ncbi:MAG: signal peptidase II [archaeon]
MKRQHVVFAGIFFLLLLLDRVTKTLILHDPSKQSFGLFDLTLVQNTGMSFGLLSSWGVVFTVLAVLALLVLGFFYVRQETYRPLLVVISAGILGNLLDRLLYGFVIDIIDFRWFPVFNLADCMISIGVLGLVVQSWLAEKKNKNRR